MFSPKLRTLSIYGRNVDLGDACFARATRITINNLVFNFLIGTLIEKSYAEGAPAIHFRDDNVVLRLGNSFQNIVLVERVPMRMGLSY
jgi:hypothetical protein